MAAQSESPSKFKTIIEYIIQITSIILSLSFCIYIFGYIIVNAYLTKYHIAQVEIIRPSFISAGLLFVIIDIIAMIITLPIARILSNSFFNLRKRTKQATDKGGVLKWYEAIGLGALYLIIALVITFVAEYINVSVVSYLTSLATWEPLKMNWTWVKPLEPFAVTFYLLGSAGLVLALAVFIYQSSSKEGNKESNSAASAAAPAAPVAPTVAPATPTAALAAPTVAPVAQAVGNVPSPAEIKRSSANYFIIPIAILTFLLLQLISLLLIANRIYEDIPASLGGGRPLDIKLYINSQGIQYIDNIDPTIIEKRFYEVPAQTNTAQTNTAQTNYVLLFWQISSTLQNGDFSSYFILPLKCIQIKGSCNYAVIQIPQKYIQGVTYYNRP
jgi:hypothetical protein